MARKQKARNGQKANPKVAEFVLRRVKANPDVTNKELQAGAAKIDKSVAKLKPAQFHGRYSLSARVIVGRGKEKKPAARPALRLAVRVQPRATSESGVHKLSQTVLDAIEADSRRRNIIGVVQVSASDLVHRALKARSAKEVTAVLDLIPTTATKIVKEIAS